MRSFSISDINVIPWEERSRFNIWEGLYTTWKFLISRPYGFFAKVSNYKGKDYPLLFGMIVVGVSLCWQIVISLTLETDRFIAELSKMGVVVKKQELAYSAILFILFFPLIYAAISFLLSWFLHIFIYILRGEGNFDSIFRIVNYSWAVGIFLILPFLGVFISGVWYLALLITGIKIVSKLNFFRTVISVLGTYLLFSLLGALFLFNFVR